jgi:PAS domain S-box-containing protein
MEILDVRTIFISYTLSNFVCAVVMGFLWHQNRARTRGLGFWIANFVMQFVAVLLIAMRGIAPDLLSIVAANVLAIAGTIVFLFGTEQFINKKISHLPNFILLAAFTAAHVYLTFIQPNLTLRTVNFSLATLILCGQIVWLLFRRQNRAQRKEISSVGHLFAAIGAVSLIRLINFGEGATNDFLHAGSFNTLVNLFYQIIYIGLTFALFLLVNRRLFRELEHDIAQRKQVETALRESERNLLEAQRVAHVGSWSWDAATDQVKWSQELYAITGLDPALPPPNFSDMAGCYTPQAWAELNELVQRTLREGEPYEVDLDVVRPDGTIRHTYAMGYVDRENEGKTASLHGTLQDITARKKAERALRNSEEKFSVAFQNIPDAILISTLAEGDIVEANDSFFRITGLTREGIQGKTIPELNLWDEKERLKFVNDLARQGRVVNLEGWFRKPDGEIAIGLISAEIIQLGEKKCVLRVLRDITEQKRAEELTRQQSEQLRILYEASRRLNGTLDLNEIYQTVCDFISVNAPNDSFVISEYDAGTQLIHCRAFWLNDAWRDISDFPPIPLEEENKGTQSRAIRSGQAILINDYQSEIKSNATSYTVNAEAIEVATDPPPDEEVIRSAMIVPLKTGNQVTGVIQVMSVKLNAYTEAQLRLLEALALHIVSAEENAILYGRVHAELNERRQINAALSESEARYRTLVENVGEGIGFVNPEEKFTFANPAAESVFGVEAGGLLGRSLLEFTTPDRFDVILEQTQLRQAGKRSSYEIEITSAEGQKRDLLLTAVPQFDQEGRFTGAFSVFRDITQRKKTEQALIEVRNLLEVEKELLSTTLMSIADAVIVTDEKGHVVLFNRAAENLTEYSFAEAVSQPLTHTLKVKIAPLLDEITDPAVYLAELEQAQRTYADHRHVPMLISRSGKRMLVAGSITGLKSPDGGTVGYVVVFHDITEQHKAEELNLLSQKMEAVGQLAAGIAHEINTPIQYVGDNIKFLEKAFSRYTETLGMYEQTLQAHLDQPVTQADLDRMLELSRQRKIPFYAGEIPKAIQESLDGTERVRKIVLAMREFSHPSIKEKKLADINHGIETTVVISRNEWKYCAEMEMDLAPDLPLVFCQIDEINQVVLNLVVNAAQAIQEKLDQTQGKTGKITITTRRKGTMVLISIQDTGTGIPEEIRERIFDPFFTTKPLGKGTGQGLSIVHNIIVKKHQGAIFVETQPGEGTLFTVELPVGEAAQQ